MDAFKYNTFGVTCALTTNTIPAVSDAWVT